MRSKHPFIRFAEHTARLMGSAVTFAIACVIVAAWAATGHYFNYSDTWQLVINTGTTVITFLMVFLIQNTQNRDMRVMHLKLDELLRATQGAHTRLIALEEMGEEELQIIYDKYSELAKTVYSRLSEGENDDDTPDVALQ